MKFRPNLTSLDERIVPDATVPESGGQGPEVSVGEPTPIVIEPQPSIDSVVASLAQVLDEAYATGLDAIEFLGDQAATLLGADFTLTAYSVESIPGVPPIPPPADLPPIPVVDQIQRFYELRGNFVGLRNQLDSHLGEINRLKAEMEANTRAIKAEFAKVFPAQPDLQKIAQLTKANDELAKALEAEVETYNGLLPAYYNARRDMLTAYWDLAEAGFPPTEPLPTTPDYPKFTPTGDLAE